MSSNTSEPVSSRSPISKAELITLLAMLSATVAFSIDAMLPALPNIGEDLSPLDPQRAQLVIATFVFGMGLGTLFTGPLSDAFGRRAIVVGGSVIYVISALVAAIANSLEVLLFARAIQGIGAAGPRVAMLAIIRDLFAGRVMARITSFVMTVFTLVPVFAPTIGAGLQWMFGWRSIFYAFAVFSIVSALWLMLRQPETLAPENRRPFRTRVLLHGFVEVFSSRQVVIAILAQTMLFGMLFAALMSSHAVFAEIYDKEATFALWFGAMAAISASSSLLNAAIVVRFGMKNVVKWSLFMQASASLAFLLLQITWSSGTDPAFWVTFLWITSVFFLAGLGLGNMNAIALQPMGHIAGTASSVIGATSTVASIAVAIPIGQMFDGTVTPLTVGVLALGWACYGLVLMLADSDEI